MAATDLALLRHAPRMSLAVLAITIVPSLYALIYLSSVWDPNAKTSELPVAIVNLDVGFDYQGRAHNVGAELTQELMRSALFGYRAMDDENQAREAVKLGQVAFAVVIPRDFSSGALPGARPGGGQVIVVLSEGNNYAAAGFARRFAAELGHAVNEELNEKRWEQLLSSDDGSGRGLAQLRAGVTRLRTGARDYQSAMVRHGAAAAQLAQGFKQAGAAVRGMDERWPADADLKALKTGAQRLVRGQRELGAGLEQLQAGAGQARAGATRLQESVAGIPFLGDTLAQGAGELVEGGQRLGEGLAAALDANAQLARGASRVDEGVARLVDGFVAMGEGVRHLADRLPQDADLDAFARSGDELARHAAQLRTGIELVGTALPATGAMQEASARGLADSVEPRLEILAPVPNNGSAFAPNMIAMALWLGAVMSVYLFNLRVISEQHAQASTLAQTLGRFAVPALVVLAQTVLIVIVLRLGLGIAVPRYGSFLLVLLGASQAFLALVFLLLRTLGEVGKLVVILLLTLQLAAGGGVMPIELTADFFKAVHDWLPFTWAVKALRASLFGAFDGDWFRSWLDLVLLGLGALLLSGLARRWIVAPRRDYRPGIEL